MQIDLCCGDKKRPQSLGVDLMPAAGVDVVHDLDRAPWPIASNSAEDILCEHGFEHVRDTVTFMRECHRILKPGGQLTIITPHYSSQNSYADPTHVRHLSAYWFRVFGPNGYLGSTCGGFSLVSTDVTFGKSLRAKLGRLVVRIRGLEKWEKNSAFLLPGSDVHTVLRKN